MRKLKIASEIKAPEQGVIHGEGFISPRGEIFDLTGDDDLGKPSLRHGDWIVNNKNWLESQGYKIKFPAGLNIDSPGIMSGEVNDMLRDQLVKQGWIHIFTPDIISVWKFNARVEKKIRDLIRSYDYLIDSTEEITVHEQSIDAVYKIDLQESEDA